MNRIKFQKLLERRVEKMRKTLDSKGKEYAVSSDMLRNFREAGYMMGWLPEEALAGMLSKHLVSVFDIIKDLRAGMKASQERVDEKLGDCINYFVLLEALLTERIENGKVSSG